jgi:hypothetical protein
VSRGKKRRPKRVVPTASPNPRPITRELIPAGFAVALLVVVGGVVLLRSSGSDSTAPQRVEAIRLATLEGDPLRVPSGRPGVVIFADSTCPGVIPAAQGLADLKRRFGDRIDASFISIYPGDDRGALSRLSSTLGHPYPFAVDQSGTLANRYRIAVTGTVLVYDRDGTIVDRLIEPFPQELESAVEDQALS